MRKVYWFGHDEVAKAIETDEGHIRKLVVPVIRPGTETPMLRSQWQSNLHGKSPVIQSDDFQLSYANEHTPQEVHWHRLQVESYSSDSPMIVAALDADERQRDSSEVMVEFIRGGRLVIPPRFCHKVYLTGLTEVMQIRAEPGSLEGDVHVCEDCNNHENCHCAEITELIRKTAEEHLGQYSE